MVLQLKHTAATDAMILTPSCPCRDQPLRQPTSYYGTTASAAASDTSARSQLPVGTLPSSLLWFSAAPIII